MKRICGLILIILMLFSLFTISSCSTSNNSADDNTPNNNSQANDSAESIPEETVPFPEPDIPERDYGGIKFNVVYPFWGNYETQLFGDLETDAGTELDDAIWKRNKKIEGTININFNPIPLGQRGEDVVKKVLPAVKKSVMAGEGAYDLVLIHPMCDLSTFAQGKLLRNWNKMPGVDLSKPYWNQSVSETLAINNIMLFTANDLLIPSPSAVIFNKKLIQEYSLDNPYDFVRNGTWTWDKFSVMAKTVTKDLNGDGKYDKEDLYGFSVLLDGSGMISMMHACNQFITKKDETGAPVLDLMSEKLISLVEKVYDLVWVGNQTYTWTADVYSDLALRTEWENFFPRGHALFTFGSPGVGATKELRAMEVDFGILPYPKYDEKQKEYISLNHAGLMCVPQDVKDPEMTGIVAELFGSESMRYTIPTYFDVLLTYKGVRDDDSLEMMKIIFNNVVYDFGYCYSNFTNIAYLVPRIIANKSTDVASFYEKNAGTFEKDLKKAYDYILKYEDFDF